MTKVFQSKELLRLTLSEGQQTEMCFAYFDGAPGILVSGLVWVAAAVACYLLGVPQGVWTLLVGGAVIYPISAVMTKALGRPAKTSKDNGLNQLGMASTVWLILGCAMAYGLFLSNSSLFFPAMMATIGCRYLIFASLYAKSVFWVMGGSLIVAGSVAYFVATLPVFAAALGGAIEIIFALFVFITASPRQIPR